MINELAQENTSNRNVVFIRNGEVPRNALSPKIICLIEQDPRWEDLYKNAKRLGKEYKTDFVVYDREGTVLDAETKKYFKNRLESMGWKIEENSDYPAELIKERDIEDAQASAVTSPDTKTLFLSGTLDSTSTTSLVHEWSHIMQFEKKKDLTLEERELEAYTVAFPFSNMDNINPHDNSGDPYENFLNMVKKAATRIKQ